MKTRHKPCLILNADYTPLQVISWKRAICKQIIGKEIPGEGITVIKYYENDVVQSAGGDFFPIPAVAVSNRYINRRRSIALKKRNVLIRDKRICQYCGHEVNPKNATIDHVKPKSHYKTRGEAHKWNNVVIACLECNTKKDNKTPEQAGMKLLSIPKEPDYNSYNVNLYSSTVSPWHSDVPEEWSVYIGN